MECEVTDRRTERTRSALMIAFIDLMLAQGYESLTVECVAERANVGRSTFYMHYRSKEHILRESMKRPSSVLAIIVGGDVPTEPILSWMNHFHEQRRRNHIFFEGAARTIWVRCLADLIEPRLAALARHFRARPMLPLPLIAQQIAETQLALIAGWLTSRPSTKSDAVTEALVDTTRATMAALLKLKPDTLHLMPNEALRFRKI
jgi:AcrR family transcriptional regulator